MRKNRVVITLARAARKISKIPLKSKVIGWRAGGDQRPAWPALLRPTCIFSALLLAGCETLVPPVRTVYVNVEVPVPCAAGAKPEKPVNQYGRLPPEKRAPDIALQALKSDRAAWERYGTVLGAATAGCWE